MSAEVKQSDEKSLGAEEVAKFAIEPNIAKDVDFEKFSPSAIEILYTSPSVQQVIGGKNEYVKLKKKALENYPLKSRNAEQGYLRPLSYQIRGDTYAIKTLSDKLLARAQKIQEKARETGKDEGSMYYHYKYRFKVQYTEDHPLRSSKHLETLDAALQDTYRTEGEAQKCVSIAIKAVNEHLKDGWKYVQEAAFGGKTLDIFLVTPDGKMGGGLETKQSYDFAHAPKLKLKDLFFDNGDKLKEERGPDGNSIDTKQTVNSNNVVLKLLDYGNFYRAPILSSDYNNVRGVEPAGYDKYGKYKKYDNDFIELYLRQIPKMPFVELLFWFYHYCKEYTKSDKTHHLQDETPPTVQKQQYVIFFYFLFFFV